VQLGGGGERVQVLVLGLIPGLALHALHEQQVALAHLPEDILIAGKARLRACKRKAQQQRTLQRRSHVLPAAARFGA